MTRYALKYGVIYLCLVLASDFFLPTCSAQSEEEMQVLRMFYKGEDLVITPTRHPKHVSQVHENITIITSSDIEEMNAHTVAEVLNHVPGLFISFNQDFGATSLISIQGSEPRHVLVLVDDVPWNLMSEGSAQTGSIPVGIIDHIEIIKGPASSAWGSSLGGVVNIITKHTGTTPTPTGAVRASYGEGSSRDLRVEAAGTAGPIQYYVYAGDQDSDGLRSSRGFDNQSVYSKFEMPISDALRMGLTMGYSDPHVEIGDFPSRDITQNVFDRTFFATAFVDANLSPELGLEVSAYHFRQKLVQTNEALGMGFSGPAGGLFLKSIFDEETTGASAKLVWSRENHITVLGATFDDGELDQTINTGPVIQSMGISEMIETRPGLEKWAVYLNNTMNFGPWSITPGIRYDHDSVTGSFVSPSLGATFRMNSHTVFRASIARGYTIPPLSWSSGGALFLDPNPVLDQEEVWSYQVGVETGVIEYVWVKANLFRHEVDDVFELDLFGGGPPAFNDRMVNSGEVRRQGVELEFETRPVLHLSLFGGWSYVNLDPPNDVGSEDIYTMTVTLQYDDPSLLKAQLHGQYIWWDMDQSFKARYDDIVWDLNMSKALWSRGQTGLDLFFTAHNLFSGSQYPFEEAKNPERWAEVGIRFNF